MGNREIIIISRRSDSSTVANDLYNNYTAASTRQTHDDHPPTHAHGSPTADDMERRGGRDKDSLVVAFATKQ